MQSGVGNVPNAVMAGLLDSKFENIQAYTEVIQDGMVDLIDAGKMTVASATSFSLSPEYAERMNKEAARYRESIITRPLQVSNHPEVIRRVGLIATNGMIEADIYGNVNSTNVSGSRIMNGIGGSGDFTRNGFISSFITPSLAKDGAISAIVPFASHIDHTEHDAMVIITGTVWLKAVWLHERVTPLRLHVLITVQCCRTTRSCNANVRPHPHDLLRVRVQPATSLSTAICGGK